LPRHSGQSGKRTAATAWPARPVYAGSCVGIAPQLKFARARSTFAISLCRTDTVWPSSHLIVTPLHVTPTMVPRSVTILFQHTRSPTLSCLDCSPVIKLVHNALTAAVLFLRLQPDLNHAAAGPVGVLHRLASNAGSFVAVSQADLAAVGVGDEARRWPDRPEPSPVACGSSQALLGRQSPAMCPVCTENLIRVDDVMESPKLAE
jgi:hypothetical protein